MAHPEAADTDIFIIHHISLHCHLATYHITCARKPLMNSVVHRQDQMQAIHQAVMTALAATIPTLSPSHIILWLPYKTICEKTLTNLSSLSHTSKACTHIKTFLHNAKYHTFCLCYFDRRWLGSPSKDELRTLELEQHAALPPNPATANPKPPCGATSMPTTNPTPAPHS
jgi:hypothetical protein